MRFHIVPRRRVPARARPGDAYLEDDNWDDFTFKTTFLLHLTQANGEVREVGQVKIARFGMGEGPARTKLQDTFGELGSEFFSLGQDVTYYDELTELGPDVRDIVLATLRDLAADADLFERAIEEPVTTVSLLRSISRTTVEGQFRRVIRGEDRTIRYDFNYSSQSLRTPGTDADAMTFSIVPGSNPPTNIHAVIGSNGAGKTRLLDLMRRALTTAEFGGASGTLNLTEGSLTFASVVKVSFSAFDSLDSRQSPTASSSTTKYRYIGLQANTPKDESERSTTKSAPELTQEFVESLSACVRQSRSDRWVDAIESLQSDALLKEANLGRLVADPFATDKALRAGAREAFDMLSSGHKIVLLTVTRLVELVEEQTLVLMDEPESHLHPPLLSAFVGALSHLLSETNGVAIAATHSPVVLQEVPKSCVWIVRRSGSTTIARRPQTETFGENVGALTSDVFGLEVTETGFHARLRDAAEGNQSYEQVLASFNDQVGSEGRAVAKVLVTVDEED